VRQVLLPDEPVGQAEAQSLPGHIPFVQIVGDPDPVQAIEGMVAGAEVSVAIVDPADQMVW
jgi:hypothetical protein